MRSTRGARPVTFALLAEYWPKVKMWQGDVVGVVLYVAFQVLLMPAMGLVPAPWDQPFCAQVS